jgi:hypothetical protein
MYKGILQSTGLAIAVSPKLSEPLEMSGPPVSNSGTSDFAEFDPAEQILALCIGYKPEHPKWQTRIFDFFRTYNFSPFDQKPNT